MCVQVFVWRSADWFQLTVPASGSRWQSSVWGRGVQVWAGQQRRGETLHWCWAVIFIFSNVCCCKVSVCSLQLYVTCSLRATAAASPITSTNKDCSFADGWDFNGCFKTLNFLLIRTNGALLSQVEGGEWEPSCLFLLWHRLWKRWCQWSAENR